jgi:hypothetical protein
MVAGDRNDVFAEAVIEFLSRSVPIDHERPLRGEPHPHHSIPPGDVIDIP